MKLSREDLLTYVLDEEQLSVEKVQFIELQRVIPTSGVAKWFAELDRRLGSSGEDIDWTALNYVAKDHHEFQPSSRHNENGNQKRDCSRNDQDINAIVGSISQFMRMEQHELSEIMANSIDECDRELVLRSSSGNPLQEYLGKIREVVCVRWDWRSKRGDPYYEEPANLMLSLFDAFTVVSTGIPIPPAMIVAQVLKVGLDRICNEGNKKSE